ncbi:MAG TPA: cysteine desulfurase family protein [Azospirillaceae bacterium]|nr:cysteine desulfurase family protein [Azospirillaceae bacterium]
MIYLDHNATTPLAPEALDAMLPWLKERFANPSSPHAAGQEAKAAVGGARKAVAALVGAKPSEIIVTASATEANHLAILGSLHGIGRRRHIVTTAVEHPATLTLFDDLETRDGWHVTRLPVDASGAVRLSDLEAAVDDATALVSIMAVNNETGVIMPVAEAARIAKARDALFHTDAVQAVGRVPVNVGALPADFLTFSAHKLHGPKGVGVLVARQGVALHPRVFGHQERKRRGGTENVAAIVGLGVAAELARGFLETGGMDRVAMLRDTLENGLIDRLPGCAVNGSGARVANTTNLRFPGVDAEALLIKLDRMGIQVSLGAACSSGGMAPSHVLTAMGLSAAEARASLRFSLSRHTAPGEIGAVLDTLPALHARLTA